MFRSRLINPFEGGRWRLRWMRANGWTRANGYGNRIFFRLQSIDFAWLRKIGGKRKSQLKALPCGMT
jgi:hypothetical protein